MEIFQYDGLAPLCHHVKKYQKALVRKTPVAEMKRTDPMIPM